MVKRYTITPQQAVYEYKAAGLGSISTQTLYKWLEKDPPVIIGNKVGGRWHIDNKKFLDFLKESKP